MVTCRNLRNVFLNAAVILILSPVAAPAVQWQKLTRDELHEVALDEESVRLTTNGKVAAWLKYTPLGARQRRKAAANFNKKDYRLHMEYYEFDCSDNSAVLGLAEIIGSGGKRLARLKGSGSPDIIIPGSILDKAVQVVCPEQGENLADEDPAPDAIDDTNNSEMAATADPKLTQEVQNHIKEAIKRIESEPASHLAWVNLGNAYYDADMPKLAIDSYNHALAINPDDADVLNDQGAMYRQTGDFAKALKNFEKALAIAPNNLESLYNMGYINAFDLNRIDRALDIWRHYLELDRSSDTARQVQSFIERYGK